MGTLHGGPVNLCAVLVQLLMRSLGCLTGAAPMPLTLAAAQARGGNHAAVCLSACLELPAAILQVRAISGPVAAWQLQSHASMLLNACKLEYYLKYVHPASSSPYQDAAAN